MKLGFNLLLWTTHLDEGTRAWLPRLKAAGYDGVEVPVFGGDPEHCARVRLWLADEGLAATVVGLVTSPDANPMAPEAASRVAGVAHLRWLVDCSAALGAEVLCGPFMQPLRQFSGRGPTADEWGWLVEGHRAMADHAARAGGGLRLAVEPLNRFECYALNTAADAARLVAEVGRPGVYGYLYDTFHANIDERDPVGAIGATAGTIAHVHICENDRGTPRRGHVPSAAVFGALRGAGYDGWLTVEAFGQALPDPAAATRVWRPLFGSETEVFTEAAALIRGGWAAAA